MEICLIAPASGSQEQNRHSRKTHSLPLFPPLGLMTVAALTPERHSVRIIDEGVTPIEADEIEADLIGLTANTACAPRAYELADQFRAKGLPVVMGGMHASALPQEALQHVDAVVVGEAEGLWPRLLEDFEAGCLQPIYVSETRPEAETIPAARRDLLDLRPYVAANSLQASRGCPFGCHFCTVTTFFGGSYRTRPVEAVMAEIAEMPPGPLIFVDDNIVGRPAYAERFFERLAELGRTFVAQASTTLLRWPKLIRAAAQAGCRALFIGMESISQKSLARLGKSFNVVERYKELVQRLHDHGIAVIGAFMFGLDEDAEEAIERTVEFTHEAGIDFAQFSIATPLPGTRLYEELEQAGRIHERDWRKYDGGHCVFRPIGTTPEALEVGLRRAYRAFYLSGHMLKRLIRRDDPVLSLLGREYLRRIRQWLSRWL